MAGIPETAPVGTVTQAKDALKPAQVKQREASVAIAGKSRFTRKNSAFVRQGEWFFIPAPPANRSVEYDTLSNTYATFLETEILPVVAKDYNITKDPAKRCICGSSSGAICAFTVAWERPDMFLKVVSFIGSYTNIRGGDKYPEIVKNAPNKPIRIYQQDGKNDITNQFGSWWEANQKMAAVWEAKGYDHTFIKGEGAYNGKHATMLMPDALRWIWRDIKN